MYDALVSVNSRRTDRAIRSHLRRVRCSFFILLRSEIHFHYNGLGRGSDNAVGPASRRPKKGGLKESDKVRECARGHSLRLFGEDR